MTRSPTDPALTRAPGARPPFDAALLDRLMDQAGLDALLVTSKHNVQYLLGGHRFFFFDYMDAIGVSRYLPIMIYPKGAPDQAAYVGNAMESYVQEVEPLWVPEMRAAAWGSLDAMDVAAAHLSKLGLASARIGVELAFLPSDADAALRTALPQARVTDALPVLERLRARKTPAELENLRQASERVIAAMEAVIAAHGPGTTKRALVEALRREEVNRDLNFEYCLIAAGTSHNRAPSEQRWEAGDVLSLDSGGNYRGYIGDLARMAVLGEPDAELQDLLAEIEAIQQVAMGAIAPGTAGGAIYAAAEAALAASPNRSRIHFLAHGMGMITHEAPRLTSTGPVPYAADDAERPLESGMVLSVETTLLHPRRGFIKLEDTVAVTDTGRDLFSPQARGWNRGGTAIGAAAAR
jgi:Xaa-Pro aminopeptidase